MTPYKPSYAALEQKIQKLEQKLLQQQELEKELRESEKNYRAIFEAVSDAIFVQDIETAQIIDVNKKVCQLWGYSREQLLKLQVEDLSAGFPPYSQTDAQRWIRQAVQGKTQVFEWLAKDKSDRFFWIEAHLKHTRIGGMDRLLVVVRDITESKQAQKALQKANDLLEKRVKARTAEVMMANEQLRQEIEDRMRIEMALRASEKKYRDLVQNANSLIIQTDIEGRITFFNRFAQIFFGYTEEEILGKKEIGTIIPTVDSSGLKWNVRMKDLYLHPEKYEYYENENICRDGRRVWVAWTNKAIRDEEGNIAGFLAIGNDISERRLVQKALVESERMYSTLVENSLTGIYINQSGRIVFANKRFAEIYGYSSEEIIGIESWKLVHPEDRDFVFELREKRLRGEGGITGYAARGLKKNGSIIWIERINSRIDYEGKPAILGNILDITIRKKMQEEWQKSQQELQFLSSQLLTVQEDERKRIASDLHDTIAQNLATIKIFLNNKLSQMDEQREGPEISLESIILMVQNSIQELRRIMMHLRPSILDDLGILAAINWHCREFQERHTQIRVEKKIDIDENSVPNSLKIVIYRIFQEALNNIAKHSHADLVRIVFRKKKDKIKMVILDNGTGFDLNAALSVPSYKRGLGLIGMKERTEFSKGSFLIRSRRGIGTYIRVSWPTPPLVVEPFPEYQTC
ncbi:MAG: PAS domain S-box protein [Desulfobacterales bacterium]|nr:PAS domain S-box protein [Desulfobacterales bacterium]